LIALQGGLELRIELLKQVFKSLMWASVLQTVIGLVVIGLAFLSVTRWLPFTQSMDTKGVVGVAILWGVLGITRSPSALLGIFAQRRPAGPFSRFSLSFVMASDIVVVVMLTVGIAFARPLVEPAGGMSMRDFEDMGHEILGSVSLGTTLGLTLALYLSLVGSQ